MNEMGGGGVGGGVGDKTNLLTCNFFAKSFYASINPD